MQYEKDTIPSPHIAWTAMQLDTKIDQLPESRWMYLEFQGKGPEYFKICATNIFFSVITLGIYSAWGTVKSNRYLFANTLLSGSGFEYHGKPRDFVIWRSSALVILAAVIGIGYFHAFASAAGAILIALILPWLIWRSIRLTATMTSYRGVYFNFSGGCLSLYYILIFTPFLFVVGGVLIGGGLAFLGETLDLFGLRAIDPDQIIVAGGVVAILLSIPVIHKRFTSYFLNHHQFGKGRFRARLDVGYYYWTYCKLFILASVLVVMIWSLLFLIMLVSGVELRAISQDNLRSLAGNGLLLAALLGVSIIMLLAVCWLRAYATTRFRNYAYRRLELQGAASVRSDLNSQRLFSLQLVNLLIIVLTLGLAWPWVKMRRIRYRTETTCVRVYGDIDGYVKEMLDKQSAIGEASADDFEVNLNLQI